MAKPQKSSLYDYGNVYIPIRTTISGLYRHRRDLGLHEVGYRGRNLHNRSPSLPSTPRRVLSGHGCSLRSLYLHSPSVRPMVNRSDARGPLSPGLLSYLFPLLCPSYCCVVSLLALVVVVCIIQVAHLVAHLDILFVAKPNLVRKSKNWQLPIHPLQSTISTLSVTHGDCS